MREGITDAYVAGFFDGEGSIGIYPGGGGRGFRLRTQLVQNLNSPSMLLLDYLVARWGGNGSLQVSGSGKTKYNWQLNGGKAAAFLSDIEPMLVLKRDQALLAISWQAIRPGRERERDQKSGRYLGVPSPTIEQDQAVARRLKEMKG